jgi:hypothetical protein
MALQAAAQFNLSDTFHAEWITYAQMQKLIHHELYEHV